jgi:glutathione S-transferase
MSDDVTLYMFSGSAPSLTARLMLEHKGLEHRCKHLLIGPHAFGMQPRGFDMMTVPALKIAGRPIQGSRVISRALDEIRPNPPLFPTDPQRRAAVIEAERRGEELQDATRRLVLCAARRRPEVFHAVYGHANRLMRPLQRLSRGVVVKLASAGHHASDFAGEEDLAALPARLDQIDAWIAEGLLDGGELNAADFQIAPNIALLLRFEDIAPHIDGRSAAQLARRLVPDIGAPISAVLPEAWLASLHPASRAAAPSGHPHGEP